MSSSPSTAKKVSPLKIVVMISGGGTTLRNILEHIEAGKLDVSVCAVISSSSKAKGLQYAERANCPSHVLIRKKYETTESYSEAIFNICREAKSDLIVLGGFLKHLKIPDDHINKVINIHPGLIPSFCGKGFYGHHVHQGVLDYGAKVSGCTIHFVDDDYDHGPIILQRVVDVDEEDTADTLAARVFEAECRAYPEVLALFAAGRIQVNDRKVKVLPESVVTITV